MVVFVQKTVHSTTIGETLQQREEETKRLAQTVAQNAAQLQQLTRTTNQCFQVQKDYESKLNMPVDKTVVSRLKLTRSNHGNSVNKIRFQAFMNLQEEVQGLRRGLQTSSRGGGSRGPPSGGQMAAVQPYSRSQQR